LKYLLALIGHPVSHSLSPPMHNAALKYCGLTGSYELVDIAPDQLREGIDQLKLKGFTGFNVTIPHKDAIYRMAAEHTKEASQAQASNTVKILDDGSLLAHNTDIDGFRDALNELITANQSDTACVIGTGGAAKAAILALASLGFKSIVVLSRDAAKATSLTEQMKSELPSSTTLLPASQDQLPPAQLKLVVNSSPIGQNGVPLPVWTESFLTRISGDGLIFDMVYAKSTLDTPLVALALSKGLRAVDGTEMLIRQAHKAFQFWTNESPPLEVMRAALHEARAQSL
jgi:shikimate dehydrogenase